MACAKFLVGGRVQGVYFRASTCEQARRSKLVGHARNLADGRVEVVASGMAAALDELEAWLWHGPALARVEYVLREDCAEQVPPADAFVILPG